MRKIAGALALLPLLAGCGGGGGVLNRDRPDEFAVSRTAPLVIPPDFSLRPPAPGTPTTQGSAGYQALEAMFGGEAARSAAERGLLERAGAGEVTPGIRSTVGDPDTTVTDKGTVIRDILAAPEGDGQQAQVAQPQ